MKREAKREEEEARAKGYLSGHAKHPPAWHQTQRLLEWPGCSIEARCGCGSSSSYPCKLMASRYGNGTFVDILQRLKCSRCKVPPQKCTSLPDTIGLSALAAPIPTGPYRSACADANRYRAKAHTRALVPSFSRLIV